MVDIEFNYNQRITVVQAKLDEPFQNIIKHYLQKSSLQPGSVYFLANGNQIKNPQNEVKFFADDFIKQNKKMQILVNMLNPDQKDKGPVIVKAKDIICPDCKEPCRITIENYKIKLYECVNRHETRNIKITDFENTQKVNESEIICGDCKDNNKGNCQGNSFFYYCINCKKNLCLLCKTNHDINHYIILHDQKNYICLQHNESLIKYCKQCKKNICFACEDHEEHDSLSFEKLKPKIEEKQKILIQVKSWIDEINLEVKKVIEQLNGFAETINEYYEINKRIVENYDIKRRNFQVLQNINEINNNNIIFERLKSINDIKDLKSKIYDIIDLFKNFNENNNIKIEVNKNIIDKVNKEDKINKIPSSENSNEINIIYKLNKEYEIQIFSNTFVNKYEYKCNLIIDNNKVDLCSRLKLNENQKKKETIQVKLINIQNITNMQSMFHGCCSLFSLPDLYKLDTKKIKDMSYMFYNCSSLSNISDLKQWNTKNMKDMSYMFYGCSSLSSLPDISKFNTQNVTNMNYMFSNCSSLISLPDISKWDTKNVINMSSIFNQCDSLKYLPDISKWNTKNVINMNSMFYECCSLISLPDISKWDVKSVKDMSYMFYECSSLTSFPPLSKWNKQNGTNISSIFDGCNPKIIPKSFWK